MNHHAKKNRLFPTVLGYGAPSFRFFFAKKRYTSLVGCVLKWARRKYFFYFFILSVFSPKTGFQGFVSRHMLIHGREVVAIFF